MGWRGLLVPALGNDLATAFISVLGEKEELKPLPSRPGVSPR